MITLKKQYSKNDKAIELKSDGKDYSNVDFGEHVGDKEIENIFKSTDVKYITKEEKKKCRKNIIRRKRRRLSSGLGII